MTDKTVSVRLRAVVDDYIANLDKASKATEKTTKTGSAGFQNLGSQMTAIGGEMSAKVTLPLLAVGGAATKMAVDFDKSFGQMVGLAGVAADEVDGLKDRVLDLAGETGQAPQELAEALYFIRSAGIDGQDALEALEVSAKGAAAGLGSAATIADAVTSAMNAYGPSVLSAADATDVLVATAREGKAEASELAPQFGRLLPIAAELGISFDQVGAGLAFLSRNSGDASLSATQLSGVMAKLLKPSQQGAEALEGVGLSAESIRQSIADQGLLPTLEMLRARLGDSGFNVFFDDIQGLQGALALTGQGAGQAEEVFDHLKDSTGALGEAFEAASDQPGFKLQQAFAKIQASLIDLGDTIAPVAADVAGAFATMVEFVDSLPGPLKTAAVAVGGFAAAAGPTLVITGQLLKSWMQMKTLAQGLDTSVSQIGRTVVGVGGLIGGAAAAFALWAQTMAEARAEGQGVVDDIQAKFEGLDPATMSMDKLREAIRGLGGDTADMSAELAGSQAPWDADKRAEMRAMIDAGHELEDQWKDLAGQAESLAGSMGITDDEALRLILINPDLAAKTSDTSGAFDEQAIAAAGNTAALQDMADQLKAMFDPLFGASDAAAKLAEAQAKVTAAEKDGKTSAADLQALRADAVRAAYDYESSLVTLKAAVEDGSVSVGDATATLQGWVKQGRITQEEADETKYKFGLLSGEVRNLNGKNVIIHVDANTGPAREALRRFKVDAAAAGMVTLGLYHYGNAGGGLAGTTPPGPGDNIPTLLSPGEYVMRAASVDSLGIPALEHMNRTGSMPQVAAAGSMVFAPQIAVTATPGTNGRRVGEEIVDALMEWSRNNGPLPAGIAS